MRLLPPSMRSCCTIKSRAEAIWDSTISQGRSRPKRTIITRRGTTSAGEFACRVVSEPSWPVFMACSMSAASAPRHSPTTMRSGRWRKALMTRSLMVTSPRPSAFAMRASMRTTSGCSSKRSSAESSIVTMRSFFGISRESALSSVVLPPPVPPETAMFLRARTAQDKSCAMPGESVPSPTSSSRVKARLRNFRMVKAVPSMEIGGMTTFTRCPSGSRAFTMGLCSSTRLPRGETMRSTTRRSSSSEEKVRAQG